MHKKIDTVLWHVRSASSTASAPTRLQVVALWRVVGFEALDPIAASLRSILLEDPDDTLDAHFWVQAQLDALGCPRRPDSCPLMTDVPTGAQTEALAIGTALACGVSGSDVDRVVEALGWHTDPFDLTEAFASAVAIRVCSAGETAAQHDRFGEWVRRSAHMPQSLIRAHVAAQLHLWYDSDDTRQIQLQCGNWSQLARSRDERNKAMLEACKEVADVATIVNVSDTENNSHHSVLPYYKLLADDETTAA